MTEITHSAEFTWDNGDSSVGIPAGFGEDTCAMTTCGPFRIIWLFYVDEDKPVAEWQLEDIQLQYVFDYAKNDWMHLADADTTNYTFVPRRQRVNNQTHNLPNELMASITNTPPTYHRMLHQQRPMVVGDIPALTEVVQAAYDEFNAKVQAENDAYDEMAREWEDNYDVSK